MTLGERPYIPLHLEFRRLTCGFDFAGSGAELQIRTHAVTYLCTYSRAAMDSLGCEHATRREVQGGGPRGL